MVYGQWKTVSAIDALPLTSLNAPPSSQIPTASPTGPGGRWRHPPPSRPRSRASSRCNKCRLCTGIHQLQRYTAERSQPSSECPPRTKDASNRKNVLPTCFLMISKICPVRSLHLAFAISCNCSMTFRLAEDSLWVSRIDRSERNDSGLGRVM